MRPLYFLFPAAVALAALAPAPASATMTCSFSSTVGVNFGGYNPFSSASLDSTGSLTLTCQNVGPSDLVTINLSRGSSSSFFPRTLLHGGFSLRYNLYLDAARTSVWGDGSSGTSHYGPVQPAEGSTTLTVYGRIPGLQNVGAGTYGDTIVATILF